MIAGVNDSFFLHQWYLLVPQIMLTLNLLRQLNIAPNVSGYSYIHETSNFNWMLLALMGCAMKFHLKPNNRKHRASIQWTDVTFGHHWNIINVIKFLSCWQGKPNLRHGVFQTEGYHQTNIQSCWCHCQRIWRLKTTLQGLAIIKNATHMEAFTKMQDQFTPWHQLPLDMMP